jgi:hypothetical protein
MSIAAIDDDVVARRSDTPCEGTWALAWMTHAVPERADGLVGCASAFTSLKWSVISVTIAIVLTLRFGTVLGGIHGR